MSLYGKRKAKIRARLFVHQDGRCAYCNNDLIMEEATLDHVEAKKRGGKDHQGNLVLACRPCNQKKGHLPVEKFQARASPGESPPAPAVKLSDLPAFQQIREAFVGGRNGR